MHLADTVIICALVLVLFSFQFKIDCEKKTNSQLTAYQPLFAKLLPKLNETLRKGELGRIGVVGGSKLYTGAPFFAAMTSLRVGGDMVHVFCPSEAAPIIKSYSPELMVHPSYDRNTINDSIHRIDSLILGPGLGRDQAVMRVVEDTIQISRERQLPIIIDADALYMLATKLSLIKDYPKAILTPNYPEFTRLYEHAFGSDEKLDDNKRFSGDAAKQLATYLGCTIFQKGPTDIITDGHQIEFGKTIGSPRRCGGQGDLLNGALAVFLFWALKNNDPSPNFTAARCASELIRYAAKEAYEQYGRSMVSSDMLDQLPSLIKAAEKQ